MLPNTMDTTLTAVPSAMSGVMWFLSRYTTALSPIQLAKTAFTASSSCSSGSSGKSRPACRRQDSLYCDTTFRRESSLSSASPVTPCLSLAASKMSSNAESSTPNTTLPNSCTKRRYESQAKRGFPLCSARPSTVSSFRPKFSMVSIMPGIDMAAPDLTETSSGLLADFHFLPVSRAMRDTFRRTALITLSDMVRPLL